MRGFLGEWTLAVCLVAAVLARPLFADVTRAVIYRDPSSSMIRFAAQEIAAALAKSGVAVEQRPIAGAADQPGAAAIFLEVRPDSGLKPQAYTVRAEKPSTWRVTGGDEAGAMYGGLHLAEAVRLGRGLAGAGDASGSPAVLRRGLKFNIPLDARTPSYDDTGDSAQSNVAEMWNFDFWRDFLDDMARHRYNTLSLWNPHPFPSMLLLPKYPGVALADVCGTTLSPVYSSGAWRDPQFVSPKVLENPKVLKRMSMDDKIAFWRRVMKYAKDRGISVYFITWNVIVNSVEGKHGIDARQDNPATIAYMRECVREFVLTYPDLTGIGVTAGENMKNRSDEFARERWLWNTYGLGVVDAKREQPGRQVPFIHRVWQTSVADIVDAFRGYPDLFTLEFKYAHARLYSSPAPPFAEDLVREMAPHRLACWWNLRNDDIFCFRWGDPDYVREFLRNLPPSCTAGYHMGSDGYVWGREFTSLDPDTPRQLEIRKHWYSFMLWGRLGYDPALDRGFFERLLADRFPEAPPAALYDAWAAASKIIPQVNRFHWCDWDFQWAVEGCFDQRKGFHTVDDFIRVRPMLRSGIVPVPDYVKASLAGQTVEGTTPPEVAKNLAAWADAAIAGVEAIRSRGKPGKELGQTLSDIEAMAHLGRYYAAKILGAVELEALRQSKDPKRRDAAVARLESAADHWRAYATVAARLYKPQLLARTRTLDWTQILDDVRRDIDLARGEGK
jgi:hypothetical protein